MRYKAFISYSHRDDPFVRRFHRGLERWRIPRDLVGQAGKNGIIPPTLRPIFRDRDDFASGHSLEEATQDALQNSEFLIVICSPYAARSAYVNEEIRRFKEMGRTSQVIPVILDGDPGGPDPARECFPEALRHEVGPDGSISERLANPIAADARDAGDGPQRAMAKVVAGMVGVPFDEIVRREARARAERRALLAGTGAGAFLFATSFASYALYQSHRARVTMEKSVFAIGGLVQEADNLGIGDIGEARRELLRAMCDLMEGLTDDSGRIGLIEKSICQCEQARAVAAIGDDEKALQGLEAWCAHLRKRFEAAEKPTFEVAAALARTAGELGNLRHGRAASPEERIEALANLIDEAERVSRKRPDIASVGKVFDAAVWGLAKEVEAGGDYARSLELMARGANLTGWRVPALADPREMEAAKLAQAIFLRRGAWLAVEHLGGRKEGIAMAREAVGILDQAEVPDGAAAPARPSAWTYQRMVAHEVLGRTMAAAGDVAAARESYLQAVRIGEQGLAALAGRGDAESPKPYEDELAYLRAQLEMAAKAVPIRR